MINIDYYTLKEFLSENTEFLKGAKLQKIQQPSRRDLLMTLRNSGEGKKLYINITPQFYHIAFITQETFDKRSLSIPKNPPMFCMLLRKYLEGAKITNACVVDNERILELYFEVYNELNDKSELCLTIELMGKHSNIILYDTDTSIIIGCAHNVSSEKSKFRELRGGLPYIYPPSGINNIDRVELPLYKILQEEYNTKMSINDLVDNYYAQIQQEAYITTRKSTIQSFVQSRLKKNKNSITKIQTLLNKRDKTELYKLYGELLTANLYQNCNYQKSIELFNYSTGENILIELDETKTLNENAQNYFKLYNKSKKTKEKSEEMLKNLTVEREYYENVLYSIELATDINTITEIESELGLIDEKKNNKKPDKLLNIEKIDIFGYDVFIGKNNKQNDYIVSKLAKDEDIWFHTRLCAGSHVLLKTNGKEPNEEILFECAKLARKYSSAKQPSKVAVIYTKAKNLKKPPSSPLGYVTYKNEKEILI